MRLHRNAKTTPKMRQLLIDRVTRQHWTQAAVAAAAGVSVRTVAKWIQRARQGDRQLEDASSRPHRQPRTLDGPNDRVLAFRSSGRRRGRSASASACPGRRSRGCCDAPG
jgi:transposase